MEQKMNKSLSTSTKYAGLCGWWSGVQAPAGHPGRGDNNNEAEERTAE